MCSFTWSSYFNVAFESNHNLLNPCSFSELREDTGVAESSGDFHMKMNKKIIKRKKGNNKQDNSVKEQLKTYCHAVSEVSKPFHGITRTWVTIKSEQRSTILFPKEHCL